MSLNPMILPCWRSGSWGFDPPGNVRSSFYIDKRAFCVILEIVVNKRLEVLAGGL